ncbi:MAG: helix-turn-helix transcriptional regulator [Treponema sp.]|nr:helix-turn-helix transcriptional regulator [Treponema sp.]
MTRVVDIVNYFCYTKAMRYTGEIMGEGKLKDRLANLIRSRGLSQKEVALKTNLTEGAISHYLKGDREPKGAILLSIANVLETTTDYLKGKTDEVKPAGAKDDLELALKLVAKTAPNMSTEDRDRFLRKLTMKR